MQKQGSDWIPSFSSSSIPFPFLFFTHSVSLQRTQYLLFLCLWLKEKLGSLWMMLQGHTHMCTCVQTQAHTKINSPWPLVPPNCTRANLTSCISWSWGLETIRRPSVVIFGALPKTGSSPTCRPSLEPEVGLCGHGRLYCI